MNKQLIIEAKLLNDVKFLQMCILKLYALQEADEQEEKTAKYKNLRGFSAVDSFELSIIAKNLLLGKEYDTMHSWKAIADKMYKYAKQLANHLTEEEILS